MRRRQYSPSLTELICNQDWRGVRARIRTAHGRREVRTPNPLGYPIHDACDYGAPVSVIKALLDVYPEGSRRFSMDGQLPIHMEFLRYPFPRQAVIRALLDANPVSAIQPNVSGRSWSMLFLQHERNELGSGEDQSSSLLESSTAEEENRSSGSDRDSEAKSQDSDRESDNMMSESISSRSSTNDNDGPPSPKPNQDSDSKSEDSQDSERESVSTLAASDESSARRNVNRNDSNIYGLSPHKQRTTRPHELVGRRVVMSTTASHAIGNLETIDNQGQAYSHQDPPARNRNTKTRKQARATSFTSSDGCCGSRDSIGSSSGDDEQSSCQQGDEEHLSARYRGESLSSLSGSRLATRCAAAVNGTNNQKDYSPKQNPEGDKPKRSRKGTSSAEFKAPPNLKCGDEISISRERFGEDWSKSDSSEKGSVVSSMTSSEGVSSTTRDFSGHTSKSDGKPAGKKKAPRKTESVISEGTSLTGTGSDNSVSSSCLERGSNTQLHPKDGRNLELPSRQVVNTMFGSDDSCSSDRVYQVSEQSSCRQIDSSKPNSPREGSKDDDDKNVSCSGAMIASGNSGNKRKHTSESSRILQKGEHHRKRAAKSPRRDNRTISREQNLQRTQDHGQVFQEAEYKVASDLIRGEEKLQSEASNECHGRHRKGRVVHDEHSDFGGSDSSSQSNGGSKLAFGVHRIRDERPTSNGHDAVVVSEGQVDCGLKNSKGAQ